MSGADLRHVETWLFDLDNTLYPSECGLGEQLEPRITGFVMRVTGLTRDEAFRLQKRYLAEHGLTLRGLMLDFGVDPDEYHAQFADVSLERLVRDETLIAALGRLPGRRLIFTNADARHVARVLERLGLSGLFGAVFHIGSADFVPKPSAATFERIVRAHRIAARTTAFFDDAARNLEPAAALGMTTVLVGGADAAAGFPFVDHHAERLAPFLAAARVRESVEP